MQQIVDYVEEQFTFYMENESRVKRVEFPDSRVHACLYFIAPTAHGLKPVDAEFMKVRGVFYAASHFLACRVSPLYLVLLAPVTSKASGIPPHARASPDLAVVGRARARSVVFTLRPSIYTHTRTRIYACTRTTLLEPQLAHLHTYTHTHTHITHTHTHTPAYPPTHSLTHAHTRDSHSGCKTR